MPSLIPPLMNKNVPLNTRRLIYLYASYDIVRRYAGEIYHEYGKKLISLSMAHVGGTSTYGGITTCLTLYAIANGDLLYSHLWPNVISRAKALHAPIMLTFSTGVTNTDNYFKMMAEL